MGTFKRFLLILGILLLTNVGTFFFAHWQCREKLEGKQQLIEQATDRSQELEAQLAAKEQELSRLRVWGDFIAIQEDLNRINEQINQLNFGPTFRKHRSRLEPLLVEAQQALRNRSDRARTHLVEFNREAFGILSGLEPVERDLAPTPAPPTPEPEGEEAEVSSEEDRPEDPTGEPESGEGPDEDNEGNREEAR